MVGKGGLMGSATKLIVAVTGLLVAVGTLIGAISVILGRSSEPRSGGVMIVLNSPEAYAEFLNNHPASR